MKRAASEADIKALWEELAPVIVEEFNATGTLTPSIIGICLGDDIGQIEQSFKVPQYMTNLLFAAPAADLRRKFLQHIVAPPADLGMTAPVDVAVMISEAWWVNTKSPEDAARVAREGASEQPDRQEALCLIFHTVDAEFCGFCPLDPATRKANIGKFMPPRTSLKK